MLPQKIALPSLQKKYSQDVDEEGNLNNDGLYEDVTPTSNYVENFLKWSLDSSRKAGDTGIIETEYGYHIMYYSKNNGASWTDDIEEDLAHEKLDAFSEELANSDTYKIKENKSFLGLLGIFIGFIIMMILDISF